MLNRLRPRRPGPGADGPDDRGFSLVELAVAMAVTAVLLAGVGPVVVAVLRSYGRVQDSALVNDRGRILLDRLDRDLRQVSSVNRPRAVGPRVYLEYQLDDAGGSATCTQWRLNRNDATLAVRSWRVGATGAPSWSTAASGVVNAATEPPFAVTPAGGTALHQQLQVRLRLRLPNGEAVTRTVLTARNSSVGSPSNADGDGDGDSDTPVCTNFGRS